MSRWAQENISALEMEACGPAAHICPEDQPEIIGKAIAAWADRHKLR
jgi:haloalkane dehalogenase